MTTSANPLLELCLDGYVKRSKRSSSSSATAANAASNDIVEYCARAHFDEAGLRALQRICDTQRGREQLARGDVTPIHILVRGEGIASIEKTSDQV